MLSEDTIMADSMLDIFICVVYRDIIIYGL